ncbi:MAG TPA: tetratricopeptide repeat protein [Terriglobales bacterium]|nr:tetratricopeptide repeat protein [Terriglobales bacterium]
MSLQIPAISLYSAGMRTVCWLVFLLWASSFSASQERTPSGGSEISHLQSLAEADDLPAQVALARAYLDGNGITQSDALALKWLRRAAAENYSDAENELGILYSSGRGVEKNKEEAFKWYKKAAKHGSPSGMFNLGVCYYNGDGVNIDDALAFAWFTLAKEHGSAPAVDAVARSNKELRPRTLIEGLRDIGEFYERGESLPRNVPEAVKWYSNAAEHGDTESQVRLAAIYMGTGIAADYTQARHWCEVGAKGGDSRAQYCLGTLYQRGLAVQQDPKRALRYYQQASNSGNTFAMRALAEMCVTGEAGKVDRLAAFLLYVRAGAKGDKDAIPGAAKLQKELDPGERKKADKQLPQWRIDPRKLETILSNPNSLQ